MNFLHGTGARQYSSQDLLIDFGCFGRYRMGSNVCFCRVLFRRSVGSVTEMDQTQWRIWLSGCCGCVVVWILPEAKSFEVCCEKRKERQLMESRSNRPDPNPDVPI